jgi:HlyD family secretion protein
MSTKRWIVGIGVVAVAAVGVVGVLRLRGGDDGRLQVEAAPAERMRLVEKVTATGRIQPKTQVNISADVSAKITRLGVQEGDWVERGAFLVELDRERYLAAVESAEANLRVSQANAEVSMETMNKSEKDFIRTRELFEDRLETQAQLDAAQAEYLASRARHQSSLDQVEQVRAALKQARDELSKTTIFAPIAGTVSRLNKEVGEIALGSQFQEDVILELSNLEGMEALVDVDENDIVAVSIADRATIEVDALPDAVFEGEVTEIANSAKISASGTADQKTEFEVKIALDDPGSKLRPGMTASADVVTATREDALGVPIQAVAVRTPEQIGDGPQPREASDADGAPRWETDREGFVELVWVVDGATARARQVRTGIQSDTHIEILDGLAEGERIVVGSYRAISKDLRDGMPVSESAERGETPQG